MRYDAHMTDERAANRAPRTPITWLLIAANLVVFGIELASGADMMSPTAQQILRLGGDFAPYTLHGQWWRLGSAMFLHFGLVHIGMNMFVLWQARIVEVLYGHLGFIAIYVASGLLGGITSLWHAQWVVSAGASGAVFGAFGAFGAFLLIRRDRLDPTIVQRRAQSLAIFIGINFAYGLTQTGIDMSAHVGGLVTGFVVGCALAAGSRAGEQLTKRAIAALAVAIALTAGALIVMPKPFDLDGELAAFSATEAECLKQYNDAYHQYDSGALTGAQLADLVTKQVLPKWRAARARVESWQAVPSRFTAAVAVLKEYAGDREQWFTEVVTIAGGSASADVVASHKDLGERIAGELKDLNDALHP
jgi:rhomboid protease GluP